MKKVIWFGVVSLLIGIGLVGCGEKDMTKETLESIKISKVGDYLLAYDVEIDKKNNTIILQEDEYKTPYLKLEEDETSFSMERENTVASMIFSLVNMKDKSSNIEMRDKNGDKYFLFNNQEILEGEDKYSGMDFSGVIKDISENREKYRSLSELIESIEIFYEGYELDEERNELMIITNEPASAWDITMLRSKSYQDAPKDLVIKLFDDNKNKVAELKNGEIVNFNKEMFSEADFEKKYEEDAERGYENIKERIEDKIEKEANKETLEKEKLEQEELEKEKAEERGRILAENIILIDKSIEEYQELIKPKEEEAKNSGDQNARYFTGEEYSKMRDELEVISENSLRDFYIRLNDYNTISETFAELIKYREKLNE